MKTRKNHVIPIYIMAILLLLLAGLPALAEDEAASAPAPAETPAVEESATEPGEQTPAAEESVTEPSDQTPLTEEPATEPGEQTPLAEEPATEPDAQTPLAEEPATEPDEQAPVTEEPTTEPDEQIPLAEEPATEPDEPTPATEEPVTELGDQTPAPEEPATGTDVQAPVEGEPLTDPEEELAAPNGQAAEPPNVMEVLLPDEIPFDIVLFNGQGFVTSPEFQIVNRGPDPIRAALLDARLTLSDPEAFFVRPDENLPNEGNNIHLRLVCVSGAKTAAVTLGTEGSGEVFAYELAGGESGSFRLEGAVNERGDKAWGDIDISVSVRFELSAAAVETEETKETDEPN
ncbi:MAG: hypothetical protein LBK56_01415 [Gracilibacteraceae bacterium]|jgi:hypothetical protein|nr:hypothetical protein [Gracilibacteraceae bacterium]